MGRPTVYDADLLLDVALRIATEGPQGLTMTEVARGAVAPSGSVYHRFPTRATLLGTLWVRTVARFQVGFIEALEDPDPLRARVAAARHVVVWSREHPEAAGALLHGPSAFDSAGWPEKVSAQADRHNRELGRSLAGLAARTPGEKALNSERLTFVTVDVPYATVRRYLRAGAAIPAGAEQLVEQCARTFAGTIELPG